MNRDDLLYILHRYRRGEIKSADDAADLIEGKKVEPKCSCAEDHYTPVWRCAVHGDVAVDAL